MIELKGTNEGVSLYNLVKDFCREIPTPPAKSIFVLLSSEEDENEMQFRSIKNMNSNVVLAAYYIKSGAQRFHGLCFNSIIHRYNLPA